MADNQIDWDKMLNQQLDWEEWWEQYCESFEKESGVRPFEQSLAKNAYERGRTPEKAAKEDAHYMQTGEG